MKLLVFVLNNINKLDDFLVELSKRGLNGATIINSIGIAQSLYKSKSSNTYQSVIINSLRALLESTDHHENRTIFSVVDESQEKIFYKAVEKVIGSLSKENSGIIFTIPVDSVIGLSSQKDKKEKED